MRFFFRADELTRFELALFCAVVPVRLLLTLKYGTYIPEPRFPEVPLGVGADPFGVVAVDVGVASAPVESTGMPVAL